MKQSFDLSPLTSRLTVRQALAEIGHSSAPFKIGFSVLVLVVFVPLIILAFNAPQIVTQPGPLLFVLMLVGGGLYGLYDLYREINELAHASAFAGANHMRFNRDTRMVRYPGTAYQMAVYIPYFIETTDEQPMAFGQLRPDYRSRRSNSSLTQTFLRFRLPKELPHIVLQRRGRGSGSAIVYHVDNGVKMKLEGQFGDMFDLFVTKGYERDALYIFTPDVMERFIDATPDFDVEIIGSDLYFYAGNKIMFIYPRNFLKLIAIVDHVMQKFGSQSDKYHDDNQQDVPQTAAAGAASLLLSGPLRVAYAIFGGIIIVALIRLFA